MKPYIRKPNSNIELGLLFLSTMLLILIFSYSLNNFLNYLSRYYGTTPKIILCSILALVLTMEYIDWRSNAKFRKKKVTH